MTDGLDAPGIILLIVFVPMLFIILWYAQGCRQRTRRGGAQGRVSSIKPVEERAVVVVEDGAAHIDDAPSWHTIKADLHQIRARQINQTFETATSTRSQPRIVSAQASASPSNRECASLGSGQVSARPSARLAA